MSEVNAYDQFLKHASTLTDTFRIVSFYARLLIFSLALMLLLDFLYHGLRSRWNQSVLVYLLDFLLPSPRDRSLMAKVEAEAMASTIFGAPDSEPLPGNVPLSSFPAPSAPDWVSCHVCTSFAGLRCSRCRIARYCSAKCQIIHWRQGHKKECCVPTTLRKRSNAGISTKLKDDMAKALAKFSLAKARRVSELPQCASISDSSPAPSAPPLVPYQSNDEGNSSYKEVTNDPEQSREDVSSKSEDGNISETVTLSDPDVLICSICYEYLSIPVYQCENGHIMCSICSPKVKDFCPTCNSQSKHYRCRGIEKILESAKVACLNKKYGCKKIIQFIDRITHETVCLFPPCCCPITNCGFLGTPSQLSAHVRKEHNYVTKISNDRSFSTTLSRALAFRVFLEVDKGNVFILYNQRQVDGNRFSISVIGQKVMRERFFYKLKVRHGGYTKSIKGPIDIVQSFHADHAPTQSLVVPDSYFNNSYEIELKLCITPYQDACI